MYDRFASLVLRLLRVPAEPQPPHGHPDSLRVFHAGRNYLMLRLVRWGLGQLGALAGIVFWFAVFNDVEHRVETLKAERAKAIAASPQQAVPETPPLTREEYQRARRNKNVPPAEAFRIWKASMARLLARMPDYAMLAVWFFELAGLAAYLVQLPVTFLIARMDFELRWYMVTDRSLRIRHGVWKVSESTMSFANIQQVVVSQGPLQRILGLADVKVQSAGGGGGDHHEQHHREDMHLGLFHSVDNADEIRDLILARLRHFRETGLGDPDEKSAAPALPPAAGTPLAVDAPDDLLAAARELAAEARALRAVV